MSLIYKYKTVLSMSLFILVLWFFFTFKITDVPPSINGDEASIGYNAILVSKTGYDENGKFLPLFILTLDKKDWKQPVTFYLSTVLFKIFGPSLSVLREASVMIILISAILLHLLLKEIVDNKIAWLGFIIFTTTPIILIQSHLALENVAMLPFVIFWVLMLAKFDKTKRSIYIYWGGVSLGISLYTYNGMRLVVPILTILNLIFIIWRTTNVKGKKFLYNFVIFLASILPFYLLLIYSKFYYPGAVFGNNRPAPITSYQQFFLPYLSSFDLSFLYFYGDSTPYHSTRKAGVFLLTTLPFFLTGILKSIQSKKPILILVLAIFITVPLLYGFVGSIYRASRLIAIIPAYAIITAIGLSVLLKIKLKIVKITLICLTSILFILEFLSFTNDYWNLYPARIAPAFPNTSGYTLKILSDVSKSSNKTPFIDKTIYQRENIAAKFFELIYFDKPIQHWSDDLAIKNSVVLTNISSANQLIRNGGSIMNLNTLDYVLAIK